MKALPTIDLSRIREHAGAKDRGFEEFAYVLAWDMEGLDRATEIERRSTPDGGIEFSCIPVGKGNGGRWAWQAKYLFKFDASTFAQMSKSVTSALDNTPDLERYIFVLPKNLTKAAETKWKDAVIKWRKAAASRKLKVAFVFRGESELVLAATSSDRHAGATRYFFDETFLTKAFMTKQVAREVKNLGERYSPKVNVETEARGVIDAACRGPRFVQELRTMLGGPTARRPYIESAKQEQVVADGVTAVQVLLDEWNKVAAASIARLAEPGDLVFTALEAHACRLRDGIDEQKARVRDRVAVLNAESRAAASGTPGKSPAKPATPARSAASSKSKRKSAAELAEEERVRRLGALDDFSNSLWRLGHPVEDIVHYLASSDIRTATSGSVLLVGEAGCGKSHLVADLASERVAGDLPTFLLLGQQLVPGVVDPQLVAAMGLGTMTLADVLQALDVAARVRRKGRALLVIDAINEGAGAGVWESQLPGFVEALADHPWVAVVITVRDVYETSLAPAGTPADMTRSVHRGLAGHEEEALTLYASMYKLRLPDVPSLLPELTNPLFLRSLCQSVQGRGLDAIPREAASLVWVFSGLIAAVDKALRHPGRLNYADWETKAFDAVRALAAAMVDANTEALPIADADAVCQAIYPQTQHSKSLLNGLTVEGLVLRERVDRDGTPVDTVRFTYQRLSDHLRAQVILDRNPTSAKLAAAVRALSTGPRRWAMSGVVSALTLLVPETRGTELATVLRLGDTVTSDRAVHESPAAWLRGQVQRAFIETLMWRRPATWTATADRLLKRYLDAGLVEDSEWLRILSSLACVPDHPRNVEWLHPILFSLSLADRDLHWSREIGWLFAEDVNPVARTIDWAWANPDAPEDSARLASVYLAWLFTSSNRRLRDTATKALVSVTTNHPGVLTDLVVRFAHVSDLYVLDRVVAAAYGHILRRRHNLENPDDLAALRLLAQAVFDAVFDAPIPITHLMLRNRARMSAQVVDTLCRATGGDLGRDLARAQPPYSSAWPLTAPTGRQLARGFGRKWDGYRGSATEIDWEFEQNLERRVLDQIVLPDQEGLRTRRRGVLTRRRAKALAALVDVTAPSRKVRIRRRAEALIADPPATAWAFNTTWNDFEASFPKASKTPAHELRMVVGELERIDEHVFRPDADLCTRWIAARMIDLGWTKEQFGEVDNRQASLPGERPMERIAKKYERIAFQELCGHLMDHCQLDARWRGAPRNYEGPWQIYETVDVDPSLLVRGDETEADTPAARLAAIRRREENRPTWWRTLADHQLNPDGTNDSWLGVTSDIPRPDATLTATDPKGREWVALERHQEWKIKDPSDLDRSYRRDRRLLWLRSQANIIRADDVAHPRWAANTNWMGLNHLSTSADMWIGGLGEYPDVAGWPAELDLSDREHRPYEPDDDPGTIVLPMGFEFARIDDETRSPYAMATVGCHQESGQDFSTTDTPGVLMPSRLLLGLLNAQWSGGLADDGGIGLGAIEREYSWVSGGQVVAFCAANSSYGDAKVLWVRADELRKALAKHGFVMWAWTLLEKIYWTGHEPSSDRTDAFAAVRLAPGPVKVWGFTVEREEGQHRGSGGKRMRVLAERADWIDEVPMPKPPRPSKKSAKTLASERLAELQLQLPPTLIEELERLEVLAQGDK